MCSALSFNSLMFKNYLLTMKGNKVYIGKTKGKLVKGSQVTNRNKPRRAELNCVRQILTSVSLGFGSRLSARTHLLPSDAQLSSSSLSSVTLPSGSNLKIMPSILELGHSASEQLFSFDQAK